MLYFLPTFTLNNYLTERKKRVTVILLFNPDGKFLSGSQRGLSEASSAM